MLRSPEQEASIIDDPDIAMAAVNIGALATFALVQEIVPPKFQEMTRALGVADVVFNLAAWRAMRQSFSRQQ